MSDETLIELARIYREIEARIKQGQSGELFNPPAATGTTESTMKNYNCDGDACARSDGEVRLYPLGGGANLILCRTCFAKENAYRRQRAIETRAPENFPQHIWSECEVYSNQ